MPAISRRADSASRMPPIPSISPHLTAASPSRTEPMSFAITSVRIITRSNSARSICEWSTTKRTIRSCISRRYSKLCGAEMTVPVVRTGWTVIVAEGTMHDRFAETASGTPIECPPPSTTETVGLSSDAITSEMASPASTSPPMVFKRIRIPSIRSSSSSANSRGIRCSYLVVFRLLSCT